MASQADIDILIDDFCRNYAPEFFHNMNGNRILHLINQNASGSGGGSGSNFNTTFLTSSNFINATDCPLTALAAYNLAIFWNDVPRYLYKGVDWNPLVGGGFSILIPGFDATANSYNMVVTQAA